MAAKKPEGILKPEPIIDGFLCSALLGEPMDWQTLPPAIDSRLVLARSRHHGVESLLYHALEDCSAGVDWPDEVLDALRAASREQMALELLRGNYLRRLLNRFADQRIPCLVIKGEALARSVYPTPGTRTRGDADLFIPIADIHRAVAAVRDCGYDVVSSTYKAHQFRVRDRDAAVDVFEFDVHWRILSAPRYARILSFEAAWERSVALPGLQPARTLNAVDTLLLQCLHRSASVWHDRNRLIWLYDLHLLWCGMSAEQQATFVDRALALSVPEVCLEGLNESRRCFGTRISETLESKLSESAGNLHGFKGITGGYVALLIDDLIKLPDGRARRALLAELMLPGSGFLLNKYGKEGRAWLPLLYLRHLAGGIGQHLTSK